MAKEFWFNLPVKDINKSKGFFKEIGFISNPMHDANDHLGSFFIGDEKVVMMLFLDETFKSFTLNNILNTEKGTEVLFNIDAQNREEVNEMAKKVKLAGGIIYAEPGEKEGWMYGCGFKDLDGHRWTILHMDMDKMLKH
ncbi:MAG: extradiol dioxygenase [Gelidibacter sp.]